MLVFLNLPLISIWVKLLRVPYVLLFPVILMLCLVGAYSINNNILDVFIMVFFGVVGYLMKKFEYPAAPVVLALILGPMLEKSLGQSLMMSNGSFRIFLTRPIPLTMLGITFLLLVSPLLLRLWKRRRPGLLLEGQED
jgi:putative tricarboxylic transport membrane protein